MKRLLPVSAGFLSIIIQTVLVREFLITFRGNELLIGIFFMFYFLGWIIGGLLEKSIFARLKDIQRSLVNSLFILFLTFLSSYIILTILIPLSNSVTGKVFSLSVIIIAGFFTVTPITFMTCILFIKLVVNSKGSGNEIGRIYFLDGIGGFIAGVVFSFFLVGFNNVMLLVLLFGLIIILSFKYILKITFSGIQWILTGVLIILIILVSVSFHGFMQKSWELKAGFNKLLLFKNTKYSNIVHLQGKGENKDTTSILSNGRLIYSDGWEEGAKEKTGFLLNVHPSPETILVLGLPAFQSIEVLEKMKLKETTIIVNDPFFNSLSGRFFDFHGNIKIDDGRRYLKTLKNKKYDIIWVTYYEPMSISGNRYFTQEFFNLVNRHLKEDGLFIVNINGSENFLSENQGLMIANLYNTLNAEFEFIRFCPGDEFIFFASKSEFVFNPKKLFLKFQTRPTEYKEFSPEVFLIKIQPDREKYFLSILRKFDSTINTDLHPVLFLNTISVWGEINDTGILKLFSSLSKKQKIIIWIIISFIIIVSIALLFNKRTSGFSKSSITWSLITTGTTAISFELICLYLFQISFGNIYEKIGLLTGLFMFGVALGALIGLKLNKNRKTLFIALEAGIVILCLINWWFSDKMIYMKDLTVSIFIISLLFLMGLVSGIEFPIAAKLLKSFQKNLSHRAAWVLSSDLFGALIGSCIVPLLFIPAVGLKTTLILISMINLSSFLILMLKEFIIKERIPN